MHRSQNCSLCGFQYDFSSPGTSPTVHLVAKCQHLNQQRSILFKTIRDLLKFSFRDLLNIFNTSLTRDSLYATQICMGCNQIHYRGNSKNIAGVYRKNKTPKKGKLGLAQQVIDIVSHTAVFLEKVFSHPPPLHALLCIFPQYRPRAFLPAAPAATLSLVVFSERYAQDGRRVLLGLCLANMLTSRGLVLQPTLTPGNRSRALEGQPAPKPSSR